MSPAAAWEEYIYLDRGFAIQFPAKPQITAGVYASTLVKGLKTSIYSVEDDHVIYRMTVVDLAGHNEAGVNFLNEAAYNLMRTGDVLFNDFPRVYQDEKAIYGVTLVVDRHRRQSGAHVALLQQGKALSRRSHRAARQGRQGHDDAFALRPDGPLPARWPVRLRACI